MNKYIKISDISLNYRLKKGTRIKDIVSRKNQLNGNYSLGDRSVQALHNINLELNEGDRLGIVGKNGAGKSSLLKVIAGIYPPTLGNLEISGKLATLFEFATGFEMESSGYDNIIIRGVMLGETPKSIKEKIKEIADFSELGDYLNLPVKTYSSGMFIRLAFSISTSIRPDILLLDEVMAAGDAGFIEKAEKRMNELIDSVKILIFVSHSMESIKKFCNKAIWLEGGTIKANGTPEEITSLYIKNFNKSI